MRDIRKPYHNLNSNFLNHQNKILKEVEEFEGDTYSDLEFDEKNGPKMKAQNHFGIDGMGKRKKDDYDILNRDHYLSLSAKKRNLYPNFTNKKSKLTTYIFIFIIFICLTLVYFWTYVFNQTNIIVHPKYKDIEVSETFDFNVNDLIIASSSAVSQKSILKSAPKEINSKAMGEIIIYNNYSNVTQKLVKNTRFQTVDGKIFKITDSLIVPAKNGNIPGSIKTKVVADVYGAEYNINPADFSVPGFKGSPRFAGFYAKSFSKMIGGSSGIVTMVDEKDIAITKTELSNLNKQKILIDIKTLSYENYFGLKDSPIYSETDNKDELITQNKNNFSVTNFAQIIFLPNSLLSKYLANSILGVTEFHFRIDDISNLNFVLDSNVKLTDNATITVLISGKVRLIWDYDKNQIINSLADKKVAEFTEIMKNNVDYLQAQSYKLSPFWQKIFSPKERIIIVEEFK